MVLLVLAGLLTSLAITKLPPEWCVLTAVVFLMLYGILEPTEALEGFSNTGMITVGALFVVAGGIQETGALRFFITRILGQTNKEPVAVLRLMSFTAFLSAFLNNTPVVALLISPVQSWAKKVGVSPSRLLIPLSYAAILGGTLTLIGTSTNLVIDGLLKSNKLHPGLGIFSITSLGLAVMVVGTLWMVLVGHKMLPNRKSLIEQIENPREYSVVMRVKPGGLLVGLTIAEAKLRHLEHGFLAEIERDGQLLTAVSPDRVLKANDRLIFVGVAACAHEVLGVSGLEVDIEPGMNLKHHQRKLVEIVLSQRCHLVGKTVREVAFRSLYNAVILAISRGGERIISKVGDIVFEPGDTLLVETSEDFVRNHRHNPDFLLVSTLNSNGLPNSKKAPLALLILLSMVISNLVGFISLEEASLTAAIAMVLTGCLSPEEARKSIDGGVLVVIAGSLAIGLALTKTGGAQWITSLLMKFSGTSPILTLVLIYATTVLITELITNNAAAVLMFPIAKSASEQLGTDILPFAVAVMFAASAGYMLPLGYQTHLMVYGPGGYKVSDYFKVGLPLSILVGLTVILLIPLIYKF